MAIQQFTAPSNRNGRANRTNGGPLATALMPLVVDLGIPLGGYYLLSQADQPAAA